MTGTSDAGTFNTGTSNAGTFDSVLVANRGEIAVRVIRTLRRLGLRAIAVYSDADADARHVRDADVAYRLGPARAADSYLNIDRLLAATRHTGAQAVHPGYGFLAENAEFAAACIDAGLVFVGPTPAAITLMGDKIRAKQRVEAAGVPVVPGRHEPGLSDAQLIAASTEMGFPVLLKPSAGGGGKGMRRVDDAADLPEQIAAARREASAAFGDDTLLVERYVARPRHIEIQVLADAHGTVLHLGERECSLQRRHQKLVEEAPSPLLDAATRAAMGASAVAAARSCGYLGAGTVEYIVSATEPDRFYFMEMNTRLQVEHPVTELVTTVRGARGIDLVEWQLRVAAGERLDFAQDDVGSAGHAVEARVYAEDPARGFLPTGGTVLALREPAGQRARVDSGLHVGGVVGSDYDPMLAKVIGWGETRDAALRQLRAALRDTQVLGVTTNVGFLTDLLADPDVVAGNLDTGLVERVAPALTTSDTPDTALIAAACARQAAAAPHDGDPFERVDGWRLGAERDGTYAWSRHRLRKPGGAESDVLLRGPLHAARTRVDDGEAVPVSASLDAARGLLRLSVADVPSTWIVAFGPGVTWVGRDGRGWPLHTVSAWQRAGRGGAAASAGGVRLAPMPGTVTVVKVAAGDTVTAGQTLLVVEAMKMEHVITAPFAGVVSDLHVRSGQVVAMDEPLVAVEPADQHPADPNPADQDPAGQDTVRQDTASQDAASRDAGDEHPDGRGKEGR